MPQPQVEPIKASTARPYTVFGQTYTPMAQVAPYKARGTASWYGKRYHGQPTSSGEIYDMYAMTAAHPTLPIPSYARVTNLRNGKSVVVRINDRGPFHSDRLIDLSYAAAYKLGIITSGSDLVEVESIIPAEGAASRPLRTHMRAADGAHGCAAPEPIAAGAGRRVRAARAPSARDRMPRASCCACAPSWPGLRTTSALYGRDGLYRVHAGPYADRDAGRRGSPSVSSSPPSCGR